MTVRNHVVAYDWWDYKACEQFFKFFPRIMASGERLRIEGAFGCSQSWGIALSDSLVSCWLFEDLRCSWIHLHMLLRCLGFCWNGWKRCCSLLARFQLVLLVLGGCIHKGFAVIHQCWCLLIHAVLLIVQDSSDWAFVWSLLMPACLPWDLDCLFAVFCPDSCCAEVVNMWGIDDFTDGSNYSVCRGLVSYFFGGDSLPACSNQRFSQELQLLCWAKSRLLGWKRRQAQSLDEVKSSCLL